MKSRIKQFHYETNKYLRNTIYLFIFIILSMFIWRFIITPIFYNNSNFQTINYVIDYIWIFLTFGYRVSMILFNIKIIGYIIELLFLIIISFVYSLTGHGTNKIKISLFILIIFGELYLINI